MDEPNSELPAHIEETVASISQLHAKHYEAMTPLQRAVDRLTASIGRPRFVALLTLLVVGWIAANLVLPHIGWKAFDPAPFSLLSVISSLAALYTTSLILTTQRREDQLAERREQLTLELAILNEQKSAKIIQLIEDLRRDAPTISDRVDEQAEAMTRPADPEAVANAIHRIGENDFA